MLAYQLGDEIAFRILYERHSGRVMGFLRAKIRDETKARDIFQATFLKLHKSRTRYNSAYPFAPWLFMICKNELLDFLKKEKRSVEDSAAEVAPARLETLAPALDLTQLNTSQRQAVEMRFNEGSTFAEIAKALKTSQSNARQIVSRAVRVLRSYYGKK